MSEQERINFSDKITAGIISAQKRMLERKAKLGEPVVVADANGQPILISAEEALRRITDCGLH